ncbi:MAG: hypothetical protein ACD_79C00252G0006 [uncultured bacterium]|nr:MAG: hypothetical protein ACD_79C00252G0006 [uncultured bacterium]
MRVALIYHLEESLVSRFRQTMMDHLNSFKNYSAHKYYYFNLYFNPSAFRKVYRCFDAVVFHYIFAGLKWDHDLDRYTQDLKFLKDADCLKILFNQDEYIHLKEIHDFIQQCGINIVYSLARKDQFDILYPKSKLNLQQVIHCLPGYIDNKTLRWIENKGRRIPLKDRPVDIGYRGNKLPFWLGKFARIKIRIAEEFNKFQGFAQMDISTEARDVLVKRDWMYFLLSCKSLLVTEGGASILDYDGEIRKKVENYLKINPATSFEEVSDLFLSKFEGNLRYDPIGPKYFEAVMAKTCLIAYEGSHAEIFIPNKHFLEVKKDYSNITDILKKIQNHGFLEIIADNAYRDILVSGKYSYNTFIHQVDELVENNIRKEKSLPLSQVVYLNYIFCLNFILRFLLCFFHRFYGMGKYILPFSARNQIKKYFYKKIIKISFR